MICLVLPALLMIAAASDEHSLQDARNRQDRAALDRIVAQRAALAEKRPGDANAQFRLAEAESIAAEVALELRDHAAARKAAEIGIRAAERAVALKPDVADYHRILGALCGQIIPSNVLLGFRYGKCASESIERALQLDPKSWQAYLARGVGNYYLPAALGGGIDAAIRDFRKAIELNPKSADAHLWLGLALRKANRNAEARQAIAKSLELNPHRVWAKQQLDKTPAQ